MNKNRKYRGFISKARALLVLLGASAVLASLSGESTEYQSNTTVSDTASPLFAADADGFLYSRWLDGASADCADFVCDGAAELGGETYGSFVIAEKTTTGKTAADVAEIWRRAAGRVGTAFSLSSLGRRALDYTVNDKEMKIADWWRQVYRDTYLGMSDALTDNLLYAGEQSLEKASFVRTADIDFRSSLGNRPWQLGLNVLGSLREKSDEAIAWQLRGYTGEKERKGGNAGLIYRKARGEALLGINAFLDYEHARTGGDFWRWSYGGEIRTEKVDFYANHYLGITDGKRQSDGTYLYTAGGYDVELDVHLMRDISGFLSYYEWEGKYGDEKESGYRYGLKFREIGGSGLNVELILDKPEGKKTHVGGNISYRHEFGLPAKGSQQAEAGFDPRDYFFEPVRREYSQRIRHSLKKTTIQDQVFTLTPVTGGSFQLLEGGQAVTSLVSGDVPYTFEVKDGLMLSTGIGTTVGVKRLNEAYTLTLHADTRVAYRDNGKRLELFTGTVDILRNGAVASNLTVLQAGTRTLTLVGTQLKLALVSNTLRGTLYEGIVEFVQQPGMDLAVEGGTARILITISIPIDGMLVPTVTVVEVGGCGGEDGKPSTGNIRIGGIEITIGARSRCASEAGAGNLSFNDGYLLPLVASLNQAMTLATLTTYVKGGDAANTYDLVAGGPTVFGIDTNSGVLSVRAPGVVEATIVLLTARVSDSAQNRVTGIIEVRTQGRISLSLPTTQVLRAPHRYEGGVLETLWAVNGSGGGYSYAISSTSSALGLTVTTNNVNVLTLAAVDGPRTLNVIITVKDGQGSEIESALTVVIDAPLSLTANAARADWKIPINYVGKVATLVAGGGSDKADYRYGIVGTSPHFEVIADMLRIKSGTSSSATLMVTVEVSDKARVPQKVQATVTVEVSGNAQASQEAQTPLVTGLASLGLSSPARELAAVAGYTGVLATLTATGGNGSYRYTLNNTDFALLPLGNKVVLSLTNTLSGARTVTVEVRDTAVPPTTATVVIAVKRLEKVGISLSGLDTTVFSHLSGNTVVATIGSLGGEETLNRYRVLSVWSHYSQDKVTVAPTGGALWVDAVAKAHEFTVLVEVTLSHAQVRGVDGAVAMLTVTAYGAINVRAGKGNTLTVAPNSRNNNNVIYPDPRIENYRFEVESSYSGFTQHEFNNSTYMILLLATPLTASGQSARATVRVWSTPGQANHPAVGEVELEFRVPGVLSSFGVTVRGVTAVSYGYTGSVALLTVSGGSGNYSHTVLGAGPTVLSATVLGAALTLSLAQALPSGTILTITVITRDVDDDKLVTTAVPIMGLARIGLSSPGKELAAVVAGYTGVLATLTATGGNGSYRYTLNNTDFALLSQGNKMVLSLTNTLSGLITATVTVEVSDTAMPPTTATVVVTLLGLAKPSIHIDILKQVFSHRETGVVGEIYGKNNGIYYDYEEKRRWRIDYLYQYTTSIDEMTYQGGELSLSAVNGPATLTVTVQATLSDRRVRGVDGGEKVVTLRVLPPPLAVTVLNVRTAPVGYTGSVALFSVSGGSGNYSHTVLGAGPTVLAATVSGAGLTLSLAQALQPRTILTITVITRDEDDGVLVTTTVPITGLASVALTLSVTELTVAHAYTGVLLTLVPSGGSSNYNWVNNSAFVVQTVGSHVELHLTSAVSGLSTVTVGTWDTSVQSLTATVVIAVKRLEKVGISLSGLDTTVFSHLSGNTVVATIGSLGGEETLNRYRILSVWSHYSQDKVTVAPTGGALWADAVAKAHEFTVLVEVTLSHAQVRGVDGAVAMLTVTAYGAINVRAGKGNTLTVAPNSRNNNNVIYPNPRIENYRFEVESSYSGFTQHEFNNSTYMILLLATPLTASGQSARATVRVWSTPGQANHPAVGEVELEFRVPGVLSSFGVTVRGVTATSYGYTGSVALLTVSGGSGNYSHIVLGAGPTVLSATVLGAALTLSLAQALPSGTILTITVITRDVDNDKLVTTAVPITGLARIGLSSPARELAAVAGYTGVLATLTATGGNGSYRYTLNNTDFALLPLGNKVVLSLTNTLSGARTVTVEVRDTAVPPTTATVVIAVKRLEKVGISLSGLDTTVFSHLSGNTVVATIGSLGGEETLNRYRVLSVWSHYSQDKVTVAPTGGALWVDAVAKAHEFTVLVEVTLSHAQVRGVDGAVAMLTVTAYGAINVRAGKGNTLTVAPNSRNNNNVIYPDPRIENYRFEVESSYSGFTQHEFNNSTYMILLLATPLTASGQSARATVRVWSTPGQANHPAVGEVELEFRVPGVLSSFGVTVRGVTAVSYGYTGSVALLTVSGGSGNYSHTVLGAGPTVLSATVLGAALTLSLAQALPSGTILTITVITRDVDDDKLVTTAVPIMGLARIGLSSPGKELAAVVAGYTGVLATLTATGGNGSYRYTLNNTDFALLSQGNKMVLSLTNTLSGLITATVTVEVSDTAMPPTTATVVVTLLGLAKPSIHIDILKQVFSHRETGVVGEIYGKNNGIYYDYEEKRRWRIDYLYQYTTSIDEMTYQGGELSLSAVNGPATLTVTVQATLSDRRVRGVDGGEKVVTLRVLPPPLAVTVLNVRTAPVGYTGSVALFSVSGGSGNYSHTVLGAGPTVLAATVSGAGLTLSLAQALQPRTILTITVITRDEDDGVLVTTTVPITGLAGPLSLSSPARLTAVHDYTGVVTTLTAIGGNHYRYALSGSSNFALRTVGNHAELRLTSAVNPSGRLFVTVATVQAWDTAVPSVTATAMVTVEIFQELGLPLQWWNPPQLTFAGEDRPDVVIELEANGGDPYIRGSSFTNSYYYEITDQRNITSSVYAAHGGTVSLGVPSGVYWFLGATYLSHQWHRTPTIRAWVTLSHPQLLGSDYAEMTLFVTNIAPFTVNYHGRSFTSLVTVSASSPKEFQWIFPNYRLENNDAPGVAATRKLNAQMIGNSDYFELYVVPFTEPRQPKVPLNTRLRFKSDSLLSSFVAQELGATVTLLFTDTNPANADDVLTLSNVITVRSKKALSFSSPSGWDLVAAVAGYTGAVAELTATGGSGNYRYTLNNTDFALLSLGDKMVLSLTNALNGLITATVTVEVSDTAVPPATATVIVSLIGLSKPSFSFLNLKQLKHRKTGLVGEVTGKNNGEFFNFTYSRQWNIADLYRYTTNFDEITVRRYASFIDPNDINSGYIIANELSVTAAMDGPATLTVTVQATLSDRRVRGIDSAENVFTLTVLPPLTVKVLDVRTAPVGYTGSVALLSASGSIGNYSHRVLASEFFYREAGNSVLAEQIVLAATVSGAQLTLSLAQALPLGMTLTITVITRGITNYNPLSYASVTTAVAITGLVAPLTVKVLDVRTAPGGYTGSVALLSASGGDGNYAHTVLAAGQTVLAATVSGTQLTLSLAQALLSGTILTITVITRGPINYNPLSFALVTTAVPITGGLVPMQLSLRDGKQGFRNSGLLKRVPVQLSSPARELAAVAGYTGVLATLTATGGNGNYRYTLNNTDFALLPLGNKVVLSLTNTLSGARTVMVEVRDTAVPPTTATVVIAVKRLEKVGISLSGLDTTVFSHLSGNTVVATIGSLGGEETLHRYKVVSVLSPYSQDKVTVAPTGGALWVDAVAKAHEFTVLVEVTLSHAQVRGVDGAVATLTVTAYGAINVRASKGNTLMVAPNSRNNYNRIRPAPRIENYRFEVESSYSGFTQLLLPHNAPTDMILRLATPLTASGQSARATVRVWSTPGQANHPAVGEIELEFRVPEVLPSFGVTVRGVTAVSYGYTGSVALLTVSGGSGNYSHTVLGAGPTVLSATVLGAALTLSLAQALQPGTILTITVITRDVDDDKLVTTAVPITGLARIGLSSPGKELAAVVAGYTGVLATLTATGGNGNYRYALNNTDFALLSQGKKMVLSLTNALSGLITATVTVEVRDTAAPPTTATVVVTLLRLAKPSIHIDILKQVFSHRETGVVGKIYGKNNGIYYDYEEDSLWPIMDLYQYTTSIDEVTYQGGELSLSAVNGPATLTVTVQATLSDRRVRGVDGGEKVVTLRVLPPPLAVTALNVRTAPVGYTGSVALLSVSGGSGNYSHTVLAVGPTVLAATVSGAGLTLSLAQALQPRTILTITVITRDEDDGALVTTAVPITGELAPLQLSSPSSRLTAVHNYTGVVTTLTATGGIGNYNYELDNTAFALRTVSSHVELQLTGTISSDWATVTVQMWDASTQPVTVTAMVTVNMLDKVSLSLSGVSLNFVWESGHRFTVATTVDSTGGIVGLHRYRVDVPPNVRVRQMAATGGGAMVFSEHAHYVSQTPATYILVFGVTLSNSAQVLGVDGALRTLTVRVLSELEVSERLYEVLAGVVDGYTGVLATITVRGGSGNYGYAVNNTAIALVSLADKVVLSLANPLGSGLATIHITVEVRNTTLLSITATVGLSLLALAKPSIIAVQGLGPFNHRDTGWMGSVVAEHNGVYVCCATLGQHGGTSHPRRVIEGQYQYSTNIPEISVSVFNVEGTVVNSNWNGVVFRENVLYLTAGIDGPATLLVTLKATLSDSRVRGVDGTETVFTLTILEQLALSSSSSQLTAVHNYTGVVTTLSATGGFGNYSYALDNTAFALLTVSSHMELQLTGTISSDWATVTVQMWDNGDSLTPPSTVTAMVTVNMLDKVSLSLSGVSLNFVWESGHRYTVATTVDSTGGIVGLHRYRVDVPPNVRVRQMAATGGGAMVFSEHAHYVSSTPATYILVFGVTLSNPAQVLGVDGALRTLTIRVLSELEVEPRYLHEVLIGVVGGYTGVLATITVTGGSGSGNYGYAVNNTAIALVSLADRVVLSLPNTFSDLTTLYVTVEVLNTTMVSITATKGVTLLVGLAKPSIGVQGLGPFRYRDTGLVGNIVAERNGVFVVLPAKDLPEYPRNGTSHPRRLVEGFYDYSVNIPEITVRTFGAPNGYEGTQFDSAWNGVLVWEKKLYLTAGIDGPATLLVTLKATLSDSLVRGVSGTETVFTLSILEPVTLTPRQTNIEVENNYTGAVLTLSATGGNNNYRYSLNHSSFTVGTVNGVLSLTTKINGLRVFTINVTVNDNDASKGYPEPERATATVVVTVGSIYKNWKKRLPVVINANQVTAQQSNFPMLMNSTFPALIGATEKEIRFATHDSFGGIAQTLDYDIVTFNSATGKLLAWVKQPTLTSGLTTYIYFSNANAANVESASKVWNEYSAVYYLDAATTPTANEKDMTGKNPDLTSNRVPPTIAGKIGKARDFPNSPNALYDHYFIGSGNFNLPSGNSPYSFEMWLNARNNSNHVAAYGYFGGQWTTGLFNILKVNSNTQIVNSTGHWDTGGLTATVAEVYDAFHHVAAVFDGTTRRLYVDGVLKGSDTPTLALPAANKTIRLARGTGGWPFYEGAIDELKIAPVARSAGWIKAQYNNQNAPGTFYTIGAVETIN